MTGSENPFDRFSAKLYLQEYYGDIGKENQFLLDFLHETYSAWSPESIWDVGGGPTIYQLISASRKARWIRIFEYLDENRSAVELWRSGKPGGFDWSTYFAAVGSREGLGADEI